METNLKVFSLRMTTINDQVPTVIKRSDIEPGAITDGTSDEFIVNSFEADQDFMIVTTQIYLMAKRINNNEPDDLFYLYSHKTKFSIVGDIREFSPPVIAESVLVHFGRAAFEIVKDSSKKGKTYGIQIPSLAKILLWVEPFFEKK